jgi:hypothetical protein
MISESSSADASRLYSIKRAPSSHWGWHSRRRPTLAITRHCKRAKPAQVTRKAGCA